MGVTDTICWIECYNLYYYKRAERTTFTTF